MELEGANKTELLEQEPVNKTETTEEENMDKTKAVGQEQTNKTETMEQEHFETLEEDYLFLSKHLMKNTKLFIKFLTEEEKVMDPAKGEDILDEVSIFKRAQKILDFIMERNDEKAFFALYMGCLHIHLWKAADILMPENAPHEPKEEEDVEEHLPDSWPPDSHFEMIKDPTKLVLKRCGPKMKAMYQQCIKDGSDMYNMTRKDKGRLLIIDNEDFVNTTQFPARKGSHFDSAGLTYLFSNLGFEVHPKRNLTAEGMMAFLKDEASKQDELSRCSCLVLAIMSYGYDGNNGLFGTDGVDSENKAEAKNFVLMSDIKKMFTSLQHLANRPKVFLIVAQQTGDKEEPPRRRYKTKYSPAAFPSLKEPPSFPISKKIQDLPDLRYDGAESIGAMKKFPESLIQLPKFTLNPSPIALDGLTQMDGDETNATAAAKIPVDADIFEAIVSPKDMLMHHEEPHGSWFIQAFIFVMTNYGHQKHMREILEKVNELSANQTWKIAQTEEIAHCVANLTANKRLYFFPLVLAEE